MEIKPKEDKCNVCGELTWLVTPIGPMCQKCALKAYADNMMKGE